MKKTLLAASMLLLTIVANGQLRFGPQGGTNISTAEVTDLMPGDVSSKVGINIGAIAEYRLPESGLGFQAGAIYSQKGFKTDFGGETFKVNPIYLEIPVYLKYTFDLESIKIFGLGGTYGAYGIGGKISNYDETSDKFTLIDIKYGKAEDSHLTRMDFGINLGAGVEFSNFAVTAQYGLGLSNVVSEPSGNESMKNRNFSISLAYLFGGK